MVTSRLSLKTSVVREKMFFTCNQGLVTPVMMTGMLGVQESALEAWDYPTVTLTRDITIYYVIVSYDFLGIVLYGHRILCHMIAWPPMDYPIWCYIILSYILWWVLGYRLKLVLLGKMFFSCNEGRVTKVMVTGRMGRFKSQPRKNKTIPAWP